jgi:hypothetical protein
MDYIRREQCSERGICAFWGKLEELWYPLFQFVDQIVLNSVPSPSVPRPLNY